MEGINIKKEIVVVKYDYEENGIRKVNKVVKNGNRTYNYIFESNRPSNDAIENLAKKLMKII